MEHLSYTKNTDELKFITEDFPFSFLRGFSGFITDHKKNNYIFLKENDVLIPAEIIKTKFITLLQFHFRPLTVKAEELPANDEKLFLNKCVKFITSQKMAHRIIQPANYALFNAIPEKSKSSPFGTYLVQLKNKSKNDLLAAMQSRYRSAIRQFESFDPIIKEGETEVRAFSDLHKSTMLRSTHFYEDEKDIAAFIKHLPNNILVRNIYYDGLLQGGLFILYSKYGAYYMQGASADTTHASGAIKFLHYNTMLEVKQKGAKFYDFVGARLSNVSGTKLEGIQNFKKRFGSELTKGFLWKADLNLLKCKSFDALLRSRNLLKGLKNPYDIIDQETKK